MALDYNQIRHRIIELKSRGLTPSLRGYFESSEAIRTKREIALLEDRAAQLVSSRELTVETDEDIRIRRTKELLVLKDRLANEIDLQKRSYLYKAINNLANKIEGPVVLPATAPTYVAPRETVSNSFDFSDADNSMYIVLF